MTWEIVVGITVLVGFVGSIGVWISKLSTVIATLNTTIRLLETTVKEFKSRSRDTHRDLYGKIDEGEKRLDDHEGRIRVLETKERGKGQ